MHPTHNLLSKPFLNRPTALKIGLILTFSIALFWSSLRPGMGEETPDSANQVSQSGPGKAREATDRPSVEEARRQAEILQKTISSTLQLVHDRYYRVDQGLPIPASVLKEVFADLEDEYTVKLRWLAVEGQAMNVDHKPQTPFEHDAVAALKSGKKAYEQIDGDIYRRVGAITLSNHCLKCHVPDRKNTRDRSAGLIIAIPIQGK